MKRKLATTLGLCLLVVALIALAVAPAASAKSETKSFSATEWFYASTPTLYKVTGGVAHMEFDNVFYHDSPTDDPMVEGWSFTHLVAVATLVDGLPADANIRGTWRTETFDGTVSEGTFNGRMNMNPEVLTWVCTIRGRGISGPGAGRLIFCETVKTGLGPEAPAALTGTILAPHGF